MRPWALPGGRTSACPTAVSSPRWPPPRPRRRLPQSQAPAPLRPVLGRRPPRPYGRNQARRGRRGSGASSRSPTSPAPPHPARILYYFSVHLRIVERPSLLIDISDQVDAKVPPSGVSLTTGRQPAHGRPGVIDSVCDRTRFWGHPAGVRHAEPFASREPVALRGSGTCFSSVPTTSIDGFNPVAKCLRRPGASETGEPGHSPPATRRPATRQSWRDGPPGVGGPGRCYRLPSGSFCRGLSVVRGTREPSQIAIGFVLSRAFGSFGERGSRHRLPSGSFCRGLRFVRGTREPSQIAIGFVLSRASVRSGNAESRTDCHRVRFVAGFRFVRGTREPSQFAIGFVLSRAFGSFGERGSRHRLPSGSFCRGLSVRSGNAGAVTDCHRVRFAAGFRFVRGTREPSQIAIGFVLSRAFGSFGENDASGRRAGLSQNRDRGGRDGPSSSSSRRPQWSCHLRGGGWETGGLAAQSE